MRTKKLVEGINREINEFVHSKNSIISRNDILVIDNNEEVIKKAIDNGAFEKFIDQIESCIEVLSSGNVKVLTFGCKRIKKHTKGSKTFSRYKVIEMNFSPIKSLMLN